MFDKLIESNSAEADFKPRRKFFMVSSVVVGIMFLSAVVFSLYAQDIDLGTDNFELSEILAPVAPDAPEPDPPREQPRQTSQPESSDVAVRRTNTARIDEVQPTPTAISTTPYTGMVRPEGKFKLDLNGVERNPGGPGSPAGTPDGSSSAVSIPETTEVVKAEPPPIKPIVVKPPPIKSEGVINGKATYLPNPAYPEAAKRVGAFGIVNVQVTIDETGKVISSKAVTGHPMLRGTAQSAAWQARFSPTLLSKIPVKVTGVIVFNFKK